MIPAFAGSSPAVPANSRNSRDKKKVANPSLMVFTGNAHPALASAIAHELGVPMGKANVGRFSDGEVMVEIMENIRGRDTRNNFV